MIAWSYRVRQFFKAVRAEDPGEDDLKLARRYLPRAGFELFRTMPPGDQRHSLTIARALLEQGYCDKALLQAALLHDIAKARVGLGYRTAVVLLNAISKNIVPHLANSNPRSWRYPLFLSLRHPELGAELAARAGLDARAVELIRTHQSPASEPGNNAELEQWHAALKTADDQN